MTLKTHAKSENHNWKNSCNSKIKIKLTFNNETENDSETIANEFNNFFVSIGHALTDNITCFVDAMSYVDNIMNSIVISYVSCVDITTTILSLQNSSTGYDELPMINLLIIDRYQCYHFFSQIFKIYILMLLILWINMIQFINISLGSETKHAIITLVDKITSSLDSGDIIIGVSLD